MSLLFLLLSLALHGHPPPDDATLIQAELLLNQGLLSEVESALGEISEGAPYLLRARAAVLLGHVEGERQNYKSAESHYRTAENLVGLVLGQHPLPDGSSRADGAQIVDAAHRGLSWSTERRMRREAVRQKAAALRSQTLGTLALIATLLCLLAVSSRSERRAQPHESRIS